MAVPSRSGLGNGRPHTLAEVGEQLQISRERVRQIENEALTKLRRLDGERLFEYHQELYASGPNAEHQLSRAIDEGHPNGRPSSSLPFDRCRLDRSPIRRRHDCEFRRRRRR